MTDLDFFVPENANLACRREYLSDSGTYKIVITPYETKEGCWNYTQGLVFRVGSDAPIADVRRNYSSFPYSFVEDHPNGHPYLICGADYQGQTVIELDTGARRDFVPEAAEDGCGFCWVDYRFDAQSTILVVAGCLWGAPYEYRFYDFSKPMEGWPEIASEWADAGEKWPEISSDGLIRCYELEPDDDHDELPIEQRTMASIHTYRRHGQELRFVQMWLSEAEMARRVERAESTRRRKAWRKEFRASDPLYLEYRQQLQDLSLNPEGMEGVGITYKGWCPTFTGEEERWCRRIIEAQSHTVDLEWGVKTGPVKVCVFRDDGKTQDEQFFEHSVEGMREAFQYAKAWTSTPLPITRAWRAE